MTTLYENLTDSIDNTNSNEQFRARMVSSFVGVDADESNVNDVALVVSNQSQNAYQPTKIYTLYDFNVVLFCTYLGMIVGGFIWMPQILDDELYYYYDTRSNSTRNGALVGSICLWFPGMCYCIAIIMDWVHRRYFGCCCCSIPSACKCEYKYNTDTAMLPHNCLTLFSVIGFIGHCVFGFYMLIWIIIDDLYKDVCWGDLIIYLGIYINLLGMDIILMKDIIPTVKNINGVREREWLLKDLSLLISIACVLAILHIVGRLTNCHSWQADADYWDWEDWDYHDSNPGLIAYASLFGILLICCIFIRTNYKDLGRLDRNGCYTCGWIMKILPILIYISLATLAISVWDIQIRLEAILIWFSILAPQLILFEIFVWITIYNGQNAGCCCKQFCAQEYNCCCKKCCDDIE